MRGAVQVRASLLGHGEDVVTAELSDELGVVPLDVRGTAATSSSSLSARITSPHSQFTMLDMAGLRSVDGGSR